MFVPIWFVGKGQTETNLAVSHPDDVMLAQVGLVQNPRAVYQDRFVVGAGDHEELALPRHDLRVSRTNTLTSEQHVAVSITAQDNATPGFPVPIHDSGPPYGNRGDDIRIDQPRGFVRLSHRSLLLVRGFTG